ncbi:MAG: hypothetical protein KC478_00525 [Bacteriovoracaceae bacterium]|nr:hypothetical protein [Bacteriovoracaceae bacterium]
MRNCLLLPVTDSAGNSLGYKVYEGIETYLKTSKWCDYKSSAELIEVFSRYRDRLQEHLKDPKVLTTVSNRTSAGSLVRVSLEYEVNQVKVEMDIVGENGTDIYFSEKDTLQDTSPDQIVQTVRSWLELYETTIPYDGKVLGVLGDQLTFTYPKKLKLDVGQGFRVRRFVSKNKHPLLKKVVEWDTDLLARGKVFNVNDNQALGLVKVYESNLKVSPNDWVVFEESTPGQVIEDTTYPEVKANQFGKLGFLTLYFDIASTSVGTNTADNNKATGFTYGVSAEVEAWLTRNYFVMGEFGRRLGTLSEQSGSLNLSEVSITSGSLKIGGGYKYLPLGFFYGPQINLTAGYASYSYDVEESSTDGFGKNSISGIFLGVGGNMPLQKGIRIFGGAQFIPFSSFDDEDNIFGSEKSSSSMVFRGGLKYQYSPLISLDAAFETQNNSVKFDSGSTTQLNYRDTVLKFGGSFIF